MKTLAFLANANGDRTQLHEIRNEDSGFRIVCAGPIPNHRPFQVELSGMVIKFDCGLTWTGATAHGIGDPEARLFA